MKNSRLRHHNISSSLDGIDGSKAVEKMLLEVSEKIRDAKSLWPRTWRASVVVVIVTSLSKSNLTHWQPMRCSKGSVLQFLRCFVSVLVHWASKTEEKNYLVKMHLFGYVILNNIVDLFSFVQIYLLRSLYGIQT